MLLSNKTWPEIKAMIAGGAEGVYFIRDGWINITVPAFSVTCEFPDADEFDLLGDLQSWFRRDWAEDFKTNFAARLIKSERLSNE